jgi:hypothetical protein
MSVKGRISVDVVFHDTDGTNAINVVTMKSYSEYPSGKVASFSGTADENGFALPLSPSTYRDASGQLVSFEYISTAAVKAESGELSFVYWDPSADNQIQTVLRAGDISVINLFGVYYSNGPTVFGRNGESASYTIILYGS